MKNKLAILIISLAGAVAAADGSTVLRCKSPDGSKETLQVSFVRFEKGELKLYEYDSKGTSIEVRNFGAEYSCIVEGVMLRYPENK